MAVEIKSSEVEVETDRLIVVDDGRMVAVPVSSCPFRSKHLHNPNARQSMDVLARKSKLKIATSIAKIWNCASLSSKVAFFSQQLVEGYVGV